MKSILQHIHLKHLMATLAVVGLCLAVMAITGHGVQPEAFAANGKARVSGVKSIGETERDIERWLMQDAGLSRREARIAINQGFKSLIGTQDATGELDELASIIRRNTAILSA